MAKKKSKPKKQQREWISSPPPHCEIATLDAATKAQVEAKVRELIDKELKPRYVEPPPEDARFNYITDIVLKWHGSTLFLDAVYACPGPNALAPSFEARFARIRPNAGGRFELAAMRHTGREWIELYSGQPLEECLEAIRDDPWFQF